MDVFDLRNQVTGEYGSYVRSFLTIRDERITTALQRGVTRDKEIGQGNGLAGALEIATRNRGDFEIWTGNVSYRVAGGRPRGFSSIPTLPGTGVRFSLDTRRPVDLSDTWIGSSGWSFIDAEAERIESEGGIDVAAECTYTGGRAPAKRLRLKVLAVLPELEDPLALDFSGVENASSSFLDELLGRLAYELGEGAFQATVRCIGMTPVVRGIANAVIAQRLHGPSGARALDALGGEQ